MRRALIPLLLSITAIAHAAGNSGVLAESRSPEAVYYANAYADHYRLPRELVHAIIMQESGWNQHALSSKGAIGLMQLMPATAAHFSVTHPASIGENVGGGVRYLAALSEMFHGDLRMVVAAYYCGEHPIQRRGLQYRNADVVAYVSAVKRRYEYELQIHHSGNTKGSNHER
jgi:soluble lytic murein transglycosylase-like protein